MPLLLLKVSLVWLSRGESIGRILKERPLHGISKVYMVLSISYTTDI